MSNLHGLLVLNEDACRLTYGAEELRDIARHVDLLAPPLTRAAASGRPDLLRQADVIFSGWGGPRLDAAFLDAAPRLKVMFYGAGSLSPILTHAVWARRVTVTSALAANAVPVAEYTLGAILVSLKHGWRLSRQVRERRTYTSTERDECPGAYRSTVGLVSLGAVARKLVELLRPFDVDVLVYDPFLDDRSAAAMGVLAVPLDELFRRSDVVSLHTPHLPETEGLITGRLLSSMPRGGTFVNTARPRVVRQDEMLAVAAARPDLQFVLDVAEPEPPSADSPLYTLPNVVLTPHIAGSAGRECRRMGRYMVEELGRYVRGEPLRWAVSREDVRHTSHRPAAPVAEAVPAPVVVPPDSPAVGYVAVAC
jgi:phosphoglycerate dehydrogenase-like enzyme